MPPDLADHPPSRTLAEAIERLNASLAAGKPAAINSPFGADEPSEQAAVDQAAVDQAAVDQAVGNRAVEDGAVGDEALSRADQTEPDDLQGEVQPEENNLNLSAGPFKISLANEQLDQLDSYCRALWSVNEFINLTRHTTYDLFVRRDLLDTCQLAQFLSPGEEVLDLGTGGGVPGIPLAIVRPDLKVSLCDSVGKKAKAVDQLVRDLKFPIYVHSARVQDVLEELTFDSVVTRAAGSVTQLCNWLKEYWHCFNRLLAIKGPKWVEERGEARHRGVLHGIRLRRIHGYKMPGTKSESVILQMEKPR